MYKMKQDKLIGRNSNPINGLGALEALIKDYNIQRVAHTMKVPQGVVKSILRGDLRITLNRVQEIRKIIE